MEQFSPLLGLSSRVMENCDGDMLIRSGKPSSGIRRQVVTGVRFWCALVMSSRVKSDDSKLCRTAFLLHTHTSGVQRVLDGITALRVTITKNRFWNTIGSLTAVTHVHSYSISLSLSFPLPFTRSLSLGYTNISLVWLDVRWCFSSRSIAGEDGVVRFNRQN